jgi:DNA sulfur modification protein DndD
MLITRIKVKNYKTYLDLDLDISVEPDRPIILIGGANGGGKTTLFESIYGALYGLDIKTSTRFKELVNAGYKSNPDDKIVLELHFKGKILDKDKQYVLTRTYMLNPNQMPVENVKLSMDGSLWNYGTATAPAQRIEAESQVNKIIKANLPKELSHYFLFDAMESGNLLKSDQLNKVIKENIESVMGFNKYVQLSKASEVIHQYQTAQRIQLANDKEEYLRLVEEKKNKTAKLNDLESALKICYEFSALNKGLYDDLKAGLNAEVSLKNQIQQTREQINSIDNNANQYFDDASEFAKSVELNVFLPKLIASLKSEYELILLEKNKLEEAHQSKLQPSQIEPIAQILLNYLNKNDLIKGEIALSEIIKYLSTELDSTKSNNTYDFIDNLDLKGLNQLFETNSNNTYPRLKNKRAELENSIDIRNNLVAALTTYESQLGGNDFALIEKYEENNFKIRTLLEAISELKIEITKIDNRIHQIDLETSQEPDPKYDTLTKLKPFFESVANELLKTKKSQIELRMKHDLNINLSAYKGVIDRVELTENLEDLTFKIYHIQGNEIYLNQLNTASKQVVIQVLLKSLHEFGDYDPPVMIDTVMGVLDETSRALVLENYFPSLSQQTILLSSDSEIRPSSDLSKIEPFIAKSYTLIRNREKQVTKVESGYFGNYLND